MIEKLYAKLDRQFITLTVILILCSILSAVLGFTPLLRFSTHTFIYGLIGGVVIVFLKIGFIYITDKRKFRKNMESWLSGKNISPTSFSEVLIQSAGEETLLRGFIFVPLINSFNFFGSTSLALAVNAFISTSIYSTRAKINYFAGIQATVLGLIYLLTHSIFAVFVARFVSEISLLVASHYKLPQLFIRRFSYVAKQAI